MAKFCDMASVTIFAFASVFALLSLAAAAPVSGPISFLTPTAGQGFFRGDDLIITFPDIDHTRFQFPVFTLINENTGQQFGVPTTNYVENLGGSGNTQVRWTINYVVPAGTNYIVLAQQTPKCVTPPCGILNPYNIQSPAFTVKSW